MISVAMKWYAHIITVILFLTSCGGISAKGREVATSPACVEDEYEARIAAIEEKKEEMLAIADNTGMFWFSGDTEFEAQDPHAYWLMNRMMQMVQLVLTPDDDWAWMLAMNESVEEYNYRLGRSIGSVEAATLAIEELNNTYYAGNQPEMNTATYVESILEHYRAVYAYHELIDYIDDDDTYLKALYYREFSHWFYINHSIYGIMVRYTYGAARYSALPMDINSTFGAWSKARADEVEIEKENFSEWRWKPFSSDAGRITERKFDKLLKFLKGRTRETVAKKLTSDWYYSDYDEAYKKAGEMDFDHFYKMLDDYIPAIEGWRQVREEITKHLPKEKQKSYREITRQIHTRLYNDLLELKEFSL